MLNFYTGLGSLISSSLAFCFLIVREFLASMVNTDLSSVIFGDFGNYIKILIKCTFILFVLNKIELI